MIRQSIHRVNEAGDDVLPQEKIGERSPIFSSKSKRIPNVRELRLLPTTPHVSRGICTMAERDETILVEAGETANHTNQNVEQQSLPLHLSKFCSSPVIMHFLDLLIQLSSPPDSLPFIANIIRGVGNPKQKIQGEASGSVDQCHSNPDIDMFARACAQRLMALTCTATILPRRFLEWCVISQCEIEEYATSPVTDRNIWIEQGLEYFQVMPNSVEEEDLRKTLEYIWDHFGEIRGTFRQAVNEVPQKW